MDSLESFVLSDGDRWYDLSKEIILRTLVKAISIDVISQCVLPENKNEIKISTKKKKQSS